MCIANTSLRDICAGRAKRSAEQGIRGRIVAEGSLTERVNVADQRAVTQQNVKVCNSWWGEHQRNDKQNSRQTLVCLTLGAAVAHQKPKEQGKRASHTKASCESSDDAIAASTQRQQASSQK